MKIHTFRLKPQQDFFDSIEEYVKQNNIQAGVILSAVGSFTHATLRLANKNTYDDYDGHFEIVSITGTVSIHGSHLHISISDREGKTIGGHVVSGCKIYTTAEVVIAEFEDVVNKR
ncbi:MAG TPA: DNA-binding protein, partial [Anaerolineales bacterium]|nr:DNA-binding protein [Anaerolineales bacterium]